MRLVATLLFASALLCDGAEIAAGRWEGSIQIPERELKVIVDLAQDKAGAWIGSIIVPGLEIKGTPLTDIVVKESEAAFAIKNALAGQQIAAARFQARLNAKGALAGDFLQGGNTAPFALEKTGPPQVELPPQSSAVAKELEGEWIGEYELLGYPRHVTIRLTNHAGGGVTTEFVVVGKKTTNLPVDLVTQQEDFIRIESHETGINYEGRFRKEAGEIKGTFEQGPLEIPLVLHRAKRVS
jgi:hypothetical protein